MLIPRAREKGRCEPHRTNSAAAAMSSDATATAAATSAMANMSVKEIKEHAIVARQ